MNMTDTLVELTRHFPLTDIVLTLAKIEERNSAVCRRNGYCHLSDGLAFQAGALRECAEKVSRDSVLDAIR